MRELLHILDRFAVHFFASMSLVLLAFFAVRHFTPKARGWLPDEWKEQLALAGLLVFAFSTLREAWDVAHGQTLLKAFTDYASWLLGCGGSVWGLYRFGKEQSE